MPIQVFIAFLVVILLIVGLAYVVRVLQKRLQKNTGVKARVHMYQNLTPKHKLVRFSDQQHTYFVLLSDHHSLLLDKATIQPQLLEKKNAERTSDEISD